MKKIPESSPSSPLLRSFYPALDGLRAVAILMVFANHYNIYAGNFAVLRWGWVGVDIFFVLSGFLITGILNDTLHRADFFRNFYIRRSLRIFPIFYGFWILLLILTPLLHSVVRIGWNRYMLTSVLYLGNYFQPGALMGLHPSPFAVPFTTALHPLPRFVDLGPLWSLCVEEQFYLAWPFVIWLVRSRRSLLRICLVVVFLEPCLRWFFLNHLSHALLDTTFIYISTFTRIDTLLVGAAIALWLRDPNLTLPTIRRTSIALSVVPALVLVTCLFAGAHRWPVDPSNPIVVTIGFSLIALTAAGILLAAIDNSSFVARALTRRPLIAIGRLSYGIYFIHDLPIQAYGGKSTGIHNHPHVFLFVIAPVAFACTYAIAWLSFRYLESPFLRLKDRLAPRPDGISDPPPLPSTPSASDLMHPTA